MFETKILTDGATPATVAESLEPVHAMLASLTDFAGAVPANTAPRPAAEADLSSRIACRYAAANSITRRRFDAILREAETIGTTGLRLIAGRSGKADPATVAAARFLGNSLNTALRRLDELLPAGAA